MSLNQNISGPEPVPAIVIPRPVSFTFHYIVFILAFIFPPYWKLGGVSTTRYVLLVLIIIAGLLWARLSSGNLRLTISKQAASRCIYFFFLLAAAGACNWKALNAVIPWRGDEDLHIDATVRAAEFLFHTNRTIFLWTTLCCGLLILLSIRRSRLTTPLAILTALFAAFSVQGERLPDIQFLLLKYPFFSRWIHAAAFSAGRLAGLEYYEITFRIIPLISAVLIAWICAMRLWRHHPPVAILWGMAVVSMPVIIYYSSWQVLELAT